jgi:hypothetical protein
VAGTTVRAKITKCNRKLNNRVGNEKKYVRI